MGFNFLRTDSSSDGRIAGLIQHESQQRGEEDFVATGPALGSQEGAAVGFLGGSVFAVLCVGDLDCWRIEAAVIFSIFDTNENEESEKQEHNNRGHAQS